MSTKAARAAPPRLPGHSPCERNHLPRMLTGVTNGAGGFFAEPYLPALSSLGTRSRGPCLPALCLPFTPHPTPPPAGEGGRSKARLGCQPPAQTQGCQGRRPPSPLWPSSASALCSAEEPAGLFLPSSHRNTHPFPPGRESQRWCPSLRATTAGSGGSAQGIRPPYRPPALKCPKASLKASVSGPLSPPCPVCGKFKGEKRVPRL